MNGEMVCFPWYTIKFVSDLKHPNNTDSRRKPGKEAELIEKENDEANDEMIVAGYSQQAYACKLLG